MSGNLAWITGAGGLIGDHLVRATPGSAPGWTVIGLTRADLDLTDLPAVRRRFAAEAPRLIIHCAALSSSPACQLDPKLAETINVGATACLAELAAGISLVFFSSDLVFDGRAGNYGESAPANPLSVYAATKTAAERIVLANPHHTVIRTSLNGGTSRAGDRGFNEALRRAWQAGRTPALFTDEFRSPVPAVVTARAVWELVAKEQPGLYHLAGAERLSRWEIGQLIAARWPLLQPRIKRASIHDYPGPPRPPDTSLNCAKIQKLLSFPLPGLAEWLARHPEEIF